MNEEEKPAPLTIRGKLFLYLFLSAISWIILAAFVFLGITTLQTFAQGQFTPYHARAIDLATCCFGALLLGKELYEVAVDD